jgi:hypothetical protein
MNDYEPTIPHETLPARPTSSATSGPSVSGSSGADAAPPSLPASSPGSSASGTGAKQARQPRIRRLFWNRRIGWIVAAALMCAVIGLSVSLASSPSATAGHVAPSNRSAGPLGSGGGGSSGGGSNARSGLAAGGASGTVGSVSTSSFTMSTSAGQKVTVNEVSSTTYQNGTSSTSASAIATAEPVLVLGTTSGTTITATQVIVQPSGSGSATSASAGVVPFQQGAPSTSKQVGQIPANYSQGSGTIVSGTTANQATEAALAAYPGGVVDRVVQLSNGEYEVHNIGVNWPHHIFVNQNFTVVGAD